MKTLIDYFTQGTERTQTLGAVGVEIETDFTFLDGTPITEAVSQCILRCATGKPDDCTVKLELGRQKIEINVAPQPTFNILWPRVQAGLTWLYGVAKQYNAVPCFRPDFCWNGPLLYVQEERDALWVQLDGRNALEHLCRCSSVQFTVDVHPADAVHVLNALNSNRELRDAYQRNERLWGRYITESREKYLPLRYGGPTSFASLKDYVTKLTEHDVVMHQGKPIRLKPQEVPDFDINLYLRSIWWHYRLRRYGNALCIELRTFPRQTDAKIPEMWQKVNKIIQDVISRKRTTLTNNEWFH
ncbi:MAG: hypothetical protein WCV85_02705 [Patescibacteria group bacterium]|jgi:hypothetical protein